MFGKAKLPIDEDMYQIFFLESPVPFPYSLACHTWVVTNSKGEIHRWEVLDVPQQCEKSWGHVHCDALAPTSGLNAIFRLRRPRFGSKVVAAVWGDGESLARKMIDFIEEEAPGYEHAFDYTAVPGPNSNSFTQWIIDNFKECGVELPWNALGKGWWEHQRR